MGRASRRWLARSSPRAWSRTEVPSSLCLARIAAAWHTCHGRRHMASSRAAARAPTTSRRSALPTRSARMDWPRSPGTVVLLASSLSISRGCAVPTRSARVDWSLQHQRQLLSQVRTKMLKEDYARRHGWFTGGEVSRKTRRVAAGAAGWWPTYQGRGQVPTGDW
jgi:hypothetical protein